jgi:hypothetical protein
LKPRRKKNPRTRSELSWSVGDVAHSELCGMAAAISWVTVTLRTSVLVDRTIVATALSTGFFVLLLVLPPFFSRLSALIACAPGDGPQREVSRHGSGELARRGDPPAPPASPPFVCSH